MGQRHGRGHGWVSCFPAPLPGCCLSGGQGGRLGHHHKPLPRARLQKPSPCGGFPPPTTSRLVFCCPGHGGLLTCPPPAREPLGHFPQHRDVALGPGDVPDGEGCARCWVLRFAALGGARVERQPGALGRRDHGAGFGLLLHKFRSTGEVFLPGIPPSPSGASRQCQSGKGSLPLPGLKLASTAPV